MAYIQPTSNIYILKDVPLNPSYDDTFTFKNKEEQFNYFINKSKFELANYSIVRERTNALKVEGDIGEYYDVNYIMFQNENFSDKWFYAFIVDVQYINPNTTLIVFQIDVMQSWMFDYKILPSLVEREHVKDDSLFANLIPENIQVNERLPFSVPFNFNGFLGSKILVAGFTEPSFDIVYGYTVIPYNPYSDFPVLGSSETSFEITNIKIAGTITKDIVYNKSNRTFTYDSGKLDLNEFTFTVKYKGGSAINIGYKSINVHASFINDAWVFAEA